MNLQGSPAGKHDNLCHLLQKTSIPEEIQQKHMSPGQAMHLIMSHFKE